MPGMPMRITRRKRNLPKAVIAGDYPGVWTIENTTRDTYQQASTNTTAMASTTITGTGSTLQVANPDPPAKKKSWMDLPQEVQEAIIEECTSNDLIALSLVSKHFHELTSQRLYRSFQIIFPDDDDVSFDGTIDSLAAGLETFATSDFNYAQFLRELSLDTVSSGAKGERAYRRYLADESCGKFLNTLMLLVMRQATKLETFNWNIRVELSRPLFKALHKIDTLQHVHLRMHTGVSCYEKPPPLPSLADEAESDTSTRDRNKTLSMGDMLFHQSLRNDKSKPAKASKPVDDTPNPPTISGFKNLQTLEVLDMDTLDYISEMKQAIENSTGTLTKLKISFSEHLARQARKPPAPVDATSDSEGEMDDFGNGLPPPPPPPQMSPSDDGSGPQKTLQAQEAKKEQEAVLGKIFGLDAKKSEESAVVDEEEQEDKFEKDSQKYIRNIMMISKKLMGSANRTQQQKEALEIIEKASKKYVEEMREEEQAKQAEVEKEKKDGAGKDGDKSDAKKTGESTAEEEAEKDNEKPGLFDDKDDKKPETDAKPDDGPNPDDIDVDEPEVVVDEAELEAGIEAAAEGNELGLTWDDLQDNVSAYSIMSLTPEERLLRDKIYNAISTNLRDNMHEPVDAATMKAVTDLSSMYETRKKAEEEEKSSVVLTNGADPVVSKRVMGEYIRATRGLQLKSLAIYLVPIKASILSKAVDLRCLKRLTLLNVGPQSAFWSHMTKENEKMPLPLHKIHTDNVTPQFLKFVEGMQKCTELFLLERSSKTEVYSYAPKSEVAMKHIRRALKDKWPGLKRLVIRNDNSYTWDADEHFLRSLCRRGSNLEELGIAFSSKGVHHLLQDFHGLKNLRALHIIGFRNDDTCHWVLREVRKFIVDVVAHHPEMKLEYIAQDNSVERIIWEKPKPKKAKDIKGKGKAKETSSEASNTTSSTATETLPVFPSLSAMISGPKEDESSSSEESEDEASDKLKSSRKGLKCRTQEQGKFYDVFGVRMWKKEILSGRV